MSGEEIDKMVAASEDIDRDYFCYENADFSFLVNILSMAANFGYYSHLASVEYASDQRWSQYMTLLAVNIVVQLSMAISAGVLVVQEQLTMFELCGDIMQGLYIRQYIYTILNFGIILFQVTSLINMARLYFFNTEE